MRRLSVYVLTALLALSCGRGEAESVPPGHGETAEVRFGLSASPSTPAGTRSSVPAPEDAIGDVTMFFYEDGLLVPELTVSGSGGGGGSFSASVSLGIGHGYEIFALANCHVSSPPPTIGEARELRYTFESLDDWSGGLPMAGYREIRVSWGMAPVQITLTRLVARLDLTIDTSGLEHGSIGFTSVKVRQMFSMMGL